jgi:hypothetical protein
VCGSKPVRRALAEWHRSNRAHAHACALRARLEALCHAETDALVRLQRCAPSLRSAAHVTE